MPELTVIWERKGSSLAFWVNVFAEVVPVFFRILSVAVTPVLRISVQFCKDFISIKARFLPWKPPEKINIGKGNFFYTKAKIKVDDCKSSFLGLNLGHKCMKNKIMGNAFTCSVEIATVVLTFCQPSREGDVFVKVNTAGKTQRFAAQAVITKLLHIPKLSRRAVLLQSTTDDLLDCLDSVDRDKSVPSVTSSSVKIHPNISVICVTGHTSF